MLQKTAIIKPFGSPLEKVCNEILLSKIHLECFSNSEILLVILLLGKTC